jgi:uncharacterized SAM-binding protein YcdF (DUF218 family)
MFFAKKIISAFLEPATAAMALLALGLVLLWHGRRQRAGLVVATIGFGLLVLGTSRFVANATLVPLEDRHPPLYPRSALEAAIAKAGEKPEWIVVLGGGETADARVPANDQLSDSGLSRVIEGIRLLREVPGTKLLLSGGVGNDRIGKHADRLAAVATMLGVRPEEMELDRSAWDTEQEAKNIASRLGKTPFFLVTSAFHMPRAAGLFRKAGTNPIPAPTHHMSLDEPGVTFNQFFPSPSALGDLAAGWHEYLGILWSKLRGRI